MSTRYKRTDWVRRLEDFSSGCSSGFGLGQWLIAGILAIFTGISRLLPVTRWLSVSLTPDVPVVSTFGVGSLKSPASIWRGVVFVALVVGMMAMGRDAFALNKSAAMQSQLATLEMPFIENQGQTDDSVKFYAKTFGGTVFVTENGELVYTLPKSEAKQRQVELPEVTSGLVLKEHLLNARHGQTIQGENKTTTQVNVFSGNDPAKWQRQLSTYSRVNLGQVYEGITLKLKAAGNNVEKLFYVTPQTNVEQIRMHIEGSQGLSVNDSQELVVATELGDVKFSAPIAFQEIDGKRVDVEVVYSVKEDNVYGFTVASYDNTHQLVIDPVLASTIIGGSNEDPPTDIALDANKNVYIVGITKSPIMPSSTNTYEGYNSGYIAKLTPELDEVVYFTYMGGNRWNGAEGVGIDDDGNAYITGVTFSSNFSTTTTEIKSCQEEGDGFLVKVNSSGELLYSTCFGGSDAEGGKDIIVAEKDIVYISGTTSSINFSGITNTHGGNRDGYVIKLDIAKNSITHGTYLGGSGDDCRMSGSCAIARDTDGYIYITGDTTSEEEDFPMVNSLCIGDSSCSTYDGSTYHGGGGAIWNGNWGGDIFVTKLSPNLSTTVYSTYLGGSGYEESYGIAVDDDGNVYVAGSTDSKDFPLKGTLKSAGSELSNSNSNITRNDDAFLTRLSWDNPSSKLDLDFSTLLGGSKSDLAANEVAVLDDQNIYVVGRTHSDDFFDGFFNEQNQPLGSNAFSNTFKGGEGKYDGYLAKLKWNETTEKLRMEFGAYLGGSDKDGIGGIALDDQGHLYLTGSTRSSNFPKNRELGTRGERDGFIIKATTTACIPPPDDMVAWYPFDEVSGKIAYDLINGNNGEYINFPTYATGKVNGALSFDGDWSNDTPEYVNVPHKSEINFGTGDFSIDFWFKGYGLQPFLKKRGDDESVGYEITIDHTVCMQCSKKFITTNLSGYSVNNCEIPDSWQYDWTHFAMTLDNGDEQSNVSLYLNGTLCSSSEVYSTYDISNTESLLIGRSSKGQNTTLDELRIFNRSLSANEVRTVYEVGQAGTCKIYDSDNDGVTTIIENSAPNDGDGNGDGFPDSQQVNVTSIPNAVDGNYLTLQVEPADCELANVEVKTESDLSITDNDADYPYGLVEFETACPEANITVFYHGSEELNGAYRKYGPKPPYTEASEWYSLPNATFGFVKVGDKYLMRASFTLKDGELGDDTVVDGNIVDIGGFAGPPAVIYYSASGKVLDTQGNAIASVTIQIGDKTAITDATGYWEIKDLAEGEYTVTASKEGYLPDSKPCVVSVNEKVCQPRFKLEPVLDVKVVPEPRIAKQGENVTYTITVTNQGEGTATRVTLADVLPDNTELVSIESLDGGSCEAETITCNLPDLTPGATANVKVVVSNSQAETLINMVTVTTQEFPTDLKKTWTRVIPYLSVSVTDQPDPIEMLKVLHYSVAVELSHNAPTDATGVTLVSQLPIGVELKSLNSDYGICDTSAFPQISCEMNDLSLASADSVSQATVEMDVELKDAGLLLLTHQAKVTASEYPAHSVRTRTTVFVPEDIQVDLALVIDVTGSMQEEINGIIKALKTFIAEREASTAPLMALLTFGDNVKLAAFTRDMDVLKGAIADLTASGGGLCEEASVEALLVAIPHTKVGGEILFATDASPYDDADVEKVMTLLRGKGIRFNAMITGDCSMQESWNELP